MYQYEYPRPALAVDLIVLRPARDNCKILLIKRKNNPYAGAWALPGGFLDENETLETAAARELLEETNITATLLTQFRAYSDPNRDPRSRVISVVFAAKIENDEQAVAGDDAGQVQWFGIGNLPELAFDHAQIVNDFMATHPN